MGNLTKNFDSSEFACRCGCGFNSISIKLVEHLQRTREILGIPLSINAGCRCEEHNRVVGGKENSAHLRGLAADISCIDSHTRYLMLCIFVGRFKRIEVGTSWLHVDVDKSLPQEVVFLS